MGVILVAPARAPRDGFDGWCAIGAVPAGLDPARRIPSIGRILEEAIESIRDPWFALSRKLGAEPSAVLAHAPACATNASDLGLMLAWTRLADRWAADPKTVLVVCDDPWLFRHLATRAGVRAERPPALIGSELGLRLRGLAARVKVSVLAVLAAIRFRPGRHISRPSGGAWVLSYAHPGSTADDTDAYFGDLMRELSGLRRVLHVDGPIARISALCRGKTASLHAFGSPLVALGLWRARWRPTIEGPNAWLIRRAAAREGGTGQAAMIAWQIHCQERWLAAANPATVVWPWENHSWERAFARACHRRDVRTVGYQHATVGRHEWNHAPASNPDETSLPERILCSGPAGAARLRGFGHEDRRMAVGGAWRIPAFTSPTRDPAGPVFVALPSNPGLAAEMFAAIRPLASAGLRFVIRDHPMTLFSFEEEPGLARARGPLDHQKGISAVLYAGTTVGLEAALGGLPTVRFRSEISVANDILPDGLDLPAAGVDDLGETLRAATLPPSLDARDIFAPVEHGLWHDALKAGPPTSRSGK